MEIKMEIEEVDNWNTSKESLPLLSLNHVSLLCKSVFNSVQFYQNVLGFCLIKRPSSFDFRGAWLFNYGIGIHLLESPSMEEYDPINDPRPINPKENHISFQCTDVELVKRRLKEWGMRYVTAVVEEGGAKVDQVFFHDPDGYMIEICNCENIPILPISACPMASKQGSFYYGLGHEYEYGYGYGYEYDRVYGYDVNGAPSCRLMENAMMENLSMDMINFSF